MTLYKIQNNVDSRYRSAVRYLFCFACVLVFVGQFKIWLGSSSLTLSSSLLVILLAFVLGLPKNISTIPKEVALLFFVLVSGLVGMAVSPYTIVSRALAAMVPLYAIIIVIVSMAFAVPKKTAIDRWTSLGGAVLSVFIIVLAVKGFAFSSGYYREKLLIETPLGLSNYLSAFLIYVYARNLGVNNRLSLLMLLGILGTLSRGGYLVVLCVTALYLLRCERYWKYVFWGVVAAFCVVFAYLGAISGFTPLGYDAYSGGLWSGLLSADSLVNRVIQWSLATHIAIQSPIFGISPSGFKTLIESVYGSETVYGPHNTILFLWMNYGLVGLLCYLFYLYRIMKKLALMTRIDRRYRGILTGYIGLFIFGMFEPLVGGISFEIMLALIAAEAIGYFRYCSASVVLCRSTKYWWHPRSSVVHVGSASQ